MDAKLLDGVETLLSTNATATGAAFNTSGAKADRAFQASVAGTGAVAATAVASSVARVVQQRNMHDDPAE